MTKFTSGILNMYCLLRSLISLPVIRQLNTSIAISTLTSGQCRLSPLIQVVQDCSQLYHFTVKLLFKLHACKNSYYSTKCHLASLPTFWDQFVKCSILKKKRKKKEKQINYGSNELCMSKHCLMINTLYHVVDFRSPR